MSESEARIDILNAVSDVLLKSENLLTYSELYKSVVTKLKSNISHRDYVSCLHEMQNYKLVNKIDKTGKRGSKVYFSLTENARIKHQLRILKIDEEYEKMRGLYQILLYFHSFKRGKLLSQRQFEYKLTQLGIRFKDFHKINNASANPLVNVPFDTDSGIYIITDFFINSSENISIAKLKSKSSGNNKIVYYFYILGFTEKEFTAYIKDLRKQKEPRPFLKRPPLVPYVFYMNYKTTEIEEAINLLRTVRLIRTIHPVFPGELRYYISDDRLIGFITMIRHIQEINFQKINAKLSYIEKPDEYDRQFLELFFGKKATSLAITRANQFRKVLKNKPNSHAEVLRIKQTIRNLGDHIDRLTDGLVKNYRNYLKSNELLTDLIISFPNIYSS